MSWHFSQALVAVYSAARSLDGRPYAPSNLTSSVVRSLNVGKTMVFCGRFPSGTTSAPSTALNGADLLTWFRVDFLAKHLVQQHTGVVLLPTCGHKCCASSLSSRPSSYLLKMSPVLPSTTPPTTASVSDTALKYVSFPRKTWVLTTYGSAIGYLHTPTCAKNYAAPSMQKHPGCRNFVQVFGKPTPLNQEWLMGWPLGWTDFAPLETGKFQSWLLKHGAC